MEMCARKWRPEKCQWPINGEWRDIGWQDYDYEFLMVFHGFLMIFHGFLMVFHGFLGS